MIDDEIRESVLSQGHLIIELLKRLDVLQKTVGILLNFSEETKERLKKVEEEVWRLSGGDE